MAKILPVSGIWGVIDLLEWPEFRTPCGNESRSLLINVLSESDCACSQPMDIVQKEKAPGHEDRGL
ncbi:MAG: hypothetical protein RSE32_15500 [Comamonas sp.]